MMPDNDPEVFLNSFKRMVTTVGMLKDQWAAVLIPCLVDLAQQAVDTVSAGESDYWKVHVAILQAFEF